MKKLFLLTAIAGLFAISNVKAQDAAMSGPKLGIGAEFAFPMGDFGDGYKFGVGGSLQYQHPIANKLNLTGSAGYLNFTGKEVTVLGTTFKNEAIGFIPVKAGLRYFLAENIFVGGELGAVFGTKDGVGTAFAYSPGVGVEFPVADKSTIELGGRYEGWSNDGTSSFIGLRLAWNFGL
ncbi:outer membrane beta-barrel protein [Pedobacter africanus]|uniref:Outer membrane protein beta-barrel domain-containing protein n=1 Tax=Pedobacter africanus TaxID=151894 RepID=A0A1W1ZN62_9SPHI|nr:outer membrane beta-barrel protein [Pedobacter africanus]SMC49965.1 Outer membrane protein beta-barrel domain-containing protein [Pedobacter africanus]